MSLYYGACTVIPQIPAEELVAAGLVGWWLIVALLILGALVAGFLTGAVKAAVVGSYTRAGEKEPSWCHAVWTMLPFVIGAVVVAVGAAVVHMHWFWGLGIGLVAGGSSSGAASSDSETAAQGAQGVNTVLLGQQFQAQQLAKLGLFGFAAVIAVEVFFSIF